MDRQIYRTEIQRDADHTQQEQVTVIAAAYVSGEVTGACGSKAVGRGAKDSIVEFGLHSSGFGMELNGTGCRASASPRALDLKTKRQTCLATFKIRKPMR